MIIIIIIILKFPILKIRPSSDPILTNPDCNQRLTLTVDYSPALINHFFSSKQCNLIRVLGFRVLIPVLGKSNPSSFSCLFYYLSNWKHNQATIRTYPTLLLQTLWQVHRATIKNLKNKIKIIYIYIYIYIYVSQSSQKLNSQIHNRQ